MLKRFINISLLILCLFTLAGCDFFQQQNPQTTNGELTTDSITISTESTTSNSTLETTQTTETTQTITEQTTETSTITEEEFDLITEVKQGTIGEMYTTRGVVTGLTDKGVLIRDDSDAIYIYLNQIPTINLGEEIEITGTTSSYGGQVQFTADSVITVISTVGINTPSQTTVLSSENISEYVENLVVGEYLELSGNLIVDGSYINLIIEGTTVKGSLQSLSSVMDLTSYSGEEVRLRGYALYVSGSTTKYLNILVNEIEIVPEVTYDLITEVKQGTIGEMYTTRGVVTGLTDKGVLIRDDSDAIYIYLNQIPTVNLGEEIEITGTTSNYGGQVQFTADSVITVISTVGINTPSQTTILSSENISEYVENLVVGEYLELSGNLIVDGSYINLIIEGTTVKGSLQSLSSVMDLTIYSGEEVRLRGYALYVSGSTTKYLNILVNEIEVISSQNNTFDLTILTVNDLHGYIEQEEDGTGGISNMAYLFNQIRDANTLDDVVLIANGDMFQGTAISNMTYGLSVLECMNAMGFDAMGIGNHEFDWEIDQILDYFDGDPTNGEADFPLLNANIYLLSDGSLLTVENGNVFQFTIVQKEGIEVGIISYIGDVYDSIIYTAVEPYEFDTNFADSVLEVGLTLESMGVDIIVVNIHGGNPSGIENYQPNQDIANLKNNNGDYLVDLVINGHTHSYQTGYINRTGGSPLVLVQAGGNGNSFGKVVFTIDTNSKEILNQNVSLVDVFTAGTNYDLNVQEIVDEYVEAMGSEALAVAGETVLYTSQLQNWVGNVMLAATGADIALSNDGGIRSNANITQGENVTLATFYEVSPFDNTIILMEITYEEMEDILYREPIFYVLDDGVQLSPGETYTLAVISYVYGWDELQEDSSPDDFDTGLIVRDLLIDDVTIKGNSQELFMPITNPEASIGLYITTYNPSSSGEIVIKLSFSNPRTKIFIL